MTSYALRSVIRQYKSLKHIENNTIEWAAINGYLDVIQWLLENRSLQENYCATSIMQYAAFYGHLDVVKFLHENRTEGCTQIAMDYASCNSNTEILEFLYNNYKHLVTKVNDKTYEDLLPFIQEDFRKVFRKIEKENIVREFISKKLVYHPSSCYMKRIVDNF